jgi:hypothetical protein
MSFDLIPSLYPETKEPQSLSAPLPSVEPVKYPEKIVSHGGHGVIAHVDSRNDSQSAFTLPDGTIVMEINSLITGNNEGWSYIRVTDGREGWIEQKYLVPR